MFGIRRKKLSVTEIKNRPITELIKEWLRSYSSRDRDMHKAAISLDVDETMPNATEQEKSTEKRRRLKKMGLDK